jgi:hypothetical protein
MAFNLSNELNLINARLIEYQGKWDKLATQYGERYEEAYGRMNEALSRNKADAGVAAAITQQFVGFLKDQVLDVMHKAVKPILDGVDKLLLTQKEVSLPAVAVPAPSKFKDNLRIFVADLFRPVTEANSRLATVATKRKIGELEFQEALDSILRSSLWYPPRSVGGNHTLRIEHALWTLYMNQLVDSYSGGNLQHVIKAATDVYPTRAEHHYWVRFTRGNHGIDDKTRFRAWLNHNAIFFNNERVQIKRQPDSIFIPQSSVPEQLTRVHQATHDAKGKVPRMTITVTELIGWKHVPPWPK